MSDVFDLIFNMFGQVVSFMKEIPLSDNVSLYDFSISVFIMTVTIVAFVPLVRTGSSNNVNNTIRERNRNERSNDSND